jgi:hypothetical protein
VLGLAGGATVATAAVLIGAPTVRAQSATGTPAVFSVRDSHPDASGTPQPGARGDYDPRARTGLDDRDAIRRALAALTASGGGILYFPPGNYRASLAPATTPNVMELGDDTHVVFDRAATLYLDPSNSYQTYGIVSAAGRTNVSVSSARIVGDGALRNFSSGGGAAIRLAGCDGAVVEDCAVSGVWGSGVLVTGAAGQPSRNVSIGNCISQSNMIGCAVASGENVSVANSSFLANFFGLCLIAGPAGANSAVRVQGSHLEANGVGIYVADAPGANEAVDVTGNTITGSNGAGVVGGGLHVTVAANVLRANTGNAIEISRGEVTLIGNSCTDNGGYGIRMTAENSLVLGNRLRANAAGGMSMAGPGNLVVDNLVT